MRFAAIDFETASGARTSACSLGIAVVEDGEIVRRREWLIRPPSLYFRPLYTEVHGITPEMVAGSPGFDALWPEIEREIGDRTLVAHNAAFDMVAVGTTITDRPLRRSVQARLRTRLFRRMSGVEASLGIGMQDAGRWYPSVEDWRIFCPLLSRGLTATNQNVPP